MPRKKTTIVTNAGPVDLTSDFTSTTAGGVNYSYTQSSNLRMFLRFGAEVTNLATFPSNDTISLAYEAPGSLVTTTETVGSRSLTNFWAETAKSNSATVTFSGASSPEDNVTTFGDGTSDSPFSVSFWIRYTEAPDGGARILYEKGRNSGGLDQEYRLEYYAPSGNFVVRLYDDSSSRQIAKEFTGIDIDDDNAWHHIVVTYDGHGSGADEDQHITLYVDGDDQESNAGTRTDNGYTAMEPASDELHIGADNNASTESDALMAEFAIWGAELSSNDVKAIYYAQFDTFEETTTFNSGYTNLSPRIQHRAMDNRPGCYPTKHRMGDKDRTGKNNIHYEDLAIQFGNKIEDDFSKKKFIFFGDESTFDTSQWVVSTGMSIRREILEVEDGEFKREECAVFSGQGTSGERFIRTSKKIRNPHYVYFELIQGPYNAGFARLNLVKPFSNHSLKVQISTNSNFSSPTTIATYNPSKDLLDFYGTSSTLIAPKKVVRLGLKDFPEIGGSYYLRIVQENFDNTFASWAIRKICIKWSNQSVTFPYQINEVGNNKFLSASFSTPHTISSLSGTGRSLKGVSDITNPFKDFEETITPFNETLVVENAEDAFFNEGLDSEVYPGFATPTRSKTKFTIDLSPREETTFGMTNRLPVTEVNALNDTSKVGSQLMVYWDNKGKKWEKRGQPLRGFNSSTPTLADYATILTGACVGFSGLTIIGTASNSDGDNFSFLSKDQLALSNKEIDQFNFPFGEQYYATSSQTIKASELGISKPFLLEGISLDFQSKFESPGSNNHDLSFLYSHPQFLRGDANKSLNSRLDRTKIITPTFFILRQFKDNYQKEVFIQSDYQLLVI